MEICNLSIYYKSHIVDELYYKLNKLTQLIQNNIILRFKKK